MNKFKVLILLILFSLVAMPALAQNNAINKTAAQNQAQKQLRINKSTTTNEQSKMIREQVKSKTESKAQLNGGEKSPPPFQF